MEDVHQTVAIPEGHWWRRLFAFAGPAYMVSVGYMDPGNWATDLEGGARFGYRLIWVLLMSNLMAVLLQTLSARLGLVTGRDLAQSCRDAYSPFVRWLLFVLCEIAIAACDLAEVLGTAIGINLLSGMFLPRAIPLEFAILITACDVFLLLAIQRFGIRKMEAFIVMLVSIIGLCFIVEIFLSKPHPAETVLLAPQQFEFMHGLGAAARNAERNGPFGVFRRQPSRRSRPRSRDQRRERAQDPTNVERPESPHGRRPVRSRRSQLSLRLDVSPSRPEHDRKTASRDDRHLRRRRHPHRTAYESRASSRHAHVDAGL